MIEIRPRVKLYVLYYEKNPICVNSLSLTYKLMKAHRNTTSKTFPIQPVALIIILLVYIRSEMFLRYVFKGRQFKDFKNSLTTEA